MLQALGLISGILSIVMVIPYVRDIFRHTTKPERASWFIWAILAFISFFSQMAKGATDSLWLTGGQTVGVAIIFFLSIKYGVGSLANRRDVIALIVAGGGLLLWYITRDAAYSLVITILIDATGGWLSIIKSYEDPGSETLSMWLMSGTSGILGALAVGSLNPILLLYPLYLVFINYTTVVAILLGRRRVRLLQI
jgi:hypothetical protein